MNGSGYGIFIWSAYGFTALAVAGLIARVVLDLRARAAELRRLEPSAPDTAHE